MPPPARSAALEQAPSLSVPPLPAESPASDARPPPARVREVALRIVKQQPTACDPLRTHVPCIYKGEQWCMFHDGEHADEPIACEVQPAPALPHRVRVCLDVVDIQPKTRILVFHEDETEGRALEPTKSRRVRLSGTADRMWRVDVSGRNGTLDWTKTTCHTLDARTMFRLGCDESFRGVPIEDYL